MIQPSMTVSPILDKMTNLNFSVVIVRTLITKPPTKKYSREELDELDELFQRDPYPSAETITEFAVKRNRSVQGIDYWFYKKRKIEGIKFDNSGRTRKYRKLSLEEVEEMEKIFEKEPFPSSETLRELAIRNKRPGITLRYWFREKRNEEGINTKTVPWRWKPEDLEVLEDEFISEAYPSKERVKELAVKLNCSISNISTWFKKRRELLVGPKPKLSATYTTEEVEEMEQIFRMEPCPNTNTITDLATKNDRSEVAIRQWFGRKRRENGIKIRQRIGEQETKILEDVLSSTSYPSDATIEALAQELNLSKYNISGWFRRRSNGNVGQKNLTVRQKEHLRNFFDSTPYPDIHQRRQLAQEIQVDEKRILKWFKFQRKLYNQ